ncbi:unnamed protein product [Adineta ricciae]|uniref:Uncharacterized protein n=1 Tax=Adineta ricciae TaxID=249248 RepID=A0A814Y858_ADIRI|nr:unnamed protein product [Adineta ricciae]
MKGLLSLFIVLCIEINSIFSTCDMTSKQLEAASSTYLRLKNERGHWHGQDHNPAIDNFEGERHLAMIELQKALGQSGTSADDIKRLMGEPTKILDQPNDVLLHELKRHNENYRYPQDTKIWVYEWRGNHDFVYFLVSKDNKVIESDWYQALE